MCDDEHAKIGTGKSVDTFRDDAKRINIQAGICFIQNGNLWLEGCHLQNLGTFLFATRETVIEVTACEGVIHLERVHLFLRCDLHAIS